MKYLLIYLKGMAMGAADVVPGVSGGTIAFVTGILDTILDSISRINPKLFKVIKQHGIKAAFIHINGAFLLALFAGILTSIFTLAKLISYLLVTHPIPVWSFFFGLIIMSVIHMFTQVQRLSIIRVVLFLIGITLAALITTRSPIDALELSYFNVFIGGSIAICAMLLPGISGSFILLLLGLYSPILASVKNLDIMILLTFAAGAIVGLLSFSHLLSALLRKYHDATIIFLIGLMLGTLTKVWPWKVTLIWHKNTAGQLVPQVEKSVSPMMFEQLTGHSNQLGLAIVALCLGIAIVWGLRYFGRDHQ